MKKNLTFWSLVFAVLMFGACSKVELSANGKDGKNEENFARGGQQGVTSYGGQATGLNATITTIQNGVVNSNQTILAQTTILPLAGGSLSASHSLANVHNAVTAETLSATITGQAGQTVSHASATNFNLTVNGYAISATSLSSTATATCGSATGSSQVQNLVVNGTPVVVTGAPNQLIFFPTGGFIMINEQTTSKGKSKNITVTSLRIVIPNAADVRVASARAEVKC